MKSLVGGALIAAWCGLAVCMSISSEAIGGGSQEPNELDPIMEISKPSSQQAYLSWLRYLLQQNKHVPQGSTTAEKRFTNFDMPYLKYKVDKRNNGIWIWMPAQGYVSVPRQQLEAQNAAGKPGKIMRYG